ncbi:MAG TPA: aldehyde dehydrogenase family protein, partial [Polyangiales bacterium]|nr:aldehyde dehydrogenase family protein [Polyangiales bacterium]
VLGRIRYTSERLEQWMKPVERECDPSFGDASCAVWHQPKGVVGNMAPWNFPADISLGPLVDILAAGNRALVKPSESAPCCAELVRSAIAEHFDPEVVSVVTGEADLARAFAEVPWDHLIYTGNPAVARLVMAAAAKNLTPVTLELGGKCPTIVAPDRVNEDTVADILALKAVKSGQVCINTDYVLAPHDALERMVAIMAQTWSAMFPSFVANPAATGIVNERHYQRLLGYVAEARERGARVIELGDERASAERRKFPLTLIVDPADDLQVMQEEIFGPILPLKPYRTLDDAIAYVNGKPRPLALYVYTDDPNVANDVLMRTISGGACVNSVAAHAAVPSLPFGGVGNSGMGCHHGYEGFQTFSHARAVFKRGSVNTWELLRPPYGELLASVAAMVVDQE